MTRIPREDDTRSHELRTEEWAPANVLPTPTPMDGWRTKWVRKEILGETDVMNMSRRSREGFVPVALEEQPTIAHASESKEQIVIGGLVLCKIPEERARARERYFDGLAEQQLTGLSNQLRQDAGVDHRMPLEEKRESKVSRSPT